MKNRAKVLLLLFVLLFTVAACGSDDEEATENNGEETAVSDLVQPEQPAAVITDNALTAQAWQWVSFLDHATGEMPIADPHNYTVDFQPDGSIQIKVDCNNAGGSYTAEGTNMSIALGPTTLVACSPESKSDQFLGYLSGAALYTVTNGRLQIELMADGGTMTFISVNAIVPTVEPPVTENPTAVPETAVIPTTAPPTDGTVVDDDARAHANGTYAAPNYTVATGDTLYSIGLRFNVSTAQIQSANGMNSDNVYTEQLLIIPGASTSPPPADSTPERVIFAPGAISASLSSAIDHGQPKQFVLAAMAGQTVQIVTRSSAEFLMITVHDTNGDSMPTSGTNGQANNDISMSLPYQGDYLIVVTPTTPPENYNLSFDITFTVQ